jgi:hypothetical protein
VFTELEREPGATGWIHGDFILLNCDPRRTTRGWAVGVLDSDDAVAPSLGELVGELVGELHVVERIHGDELAFDRDREPATDEELERQRGLSTECRAELVLEGLAEAADGAQGVAKVVSDHRQEAVFAFVDLA